MKWIIRISEIAVFFLMISFVEPNYFVTLPKIHLLYQIGKALASVAIILILIFNKKNHYRPSVIVVGAFLIETVFLVATIINKGEIMDQLEQYFVLMALLIIDYYLQNKTDSLLNSLFFIYEVLIYANFVCILVLPHGLYNYNAVLNRNYYLFGHVNDMIIYILPAIVMACIRIGRNPRGIWSLKSLRPLLMIVIGTVSILMTWSATSVIGLVVFYLIVFIDWKKLRLNALTGVLVGLGLFIFIDVLQVQSGILSSIIGALGRDMTFTGRTAVWDRVIAMIKLKPIIGYGRVSSAFSLLHLHFQQPHSRYFNAIYHGGIIAGIMLFLTYLFGSRRVDHMKTNPLAKYVVGGIWALMIMSLFESYWSPLFYTVFLLGENLESITRAGYERSAYREYIYRRNALMNARDAAVNI